MLENAGYVTLEKTFEGKRPRTWVSATKEGRKAFAAELGSLRALIDRADTKDVGTP